MTQEQVNPSDITVESTDIAQVAQTGNPAQTVNSAQVVNTVQKVQAEGADNSADNSADITSTVDTTNSATAVNAPTAETMATTVDTPSYVYALGRIQAQFPSSSVENLYKEVVFQKFGPNAGAKSLFEVLSMPEHLFLAKKMCWVLTIDGTDCYVLQAKTPALLNAFIKALQPKPTQQFEYVVAQLGDYAANNLCAGRTMKMAYVHQIQSSTIEDYCQVLSQQTDVELSKIKPLFNSMLKFCRNAGDLPAQRALNYVSLKCTGLYKIFTAPMLAQNKEGIEFEQIEAISSAGNSERQVVTLIFSYLNPESKRVEKQHINIDVTELYPFSCSELIYGEPQA